MAEIKSAIELAMERTKNLVMDEKEKEAFARRETEERAKATVRRYCEGIIDRDKFVIEYNDMQGRKTEARAVFIDTVLEEFEVTDEKERLFEILEIVGEGAGPSFVEEVKKLKRDFGREAEKRASGVKTKIKERLEKMGIRGSSLEPNVAEWEEWKDAVRETAGLFRRRLNDWKNRIETVQG